jgi:hypothetical protein
MAGSQQGSGFDPLEFMDFSQYDNNNNASTANNGLNYQQPSLSPSTSISLKSETPEGSSLFPANNQGFAAPSHQYNLYKQQTGLVPGALTTTLSMNEPQGYFQEYLELQQHDMLSTIGESDFDFSAPLGSGLDASGMDLGFESADAGLYLNSTINPSAIGGHEPDALTSPLPTTPALTGTPGRVWPGMHQQQAAIARAQQQQKQQEMQRQQQQQQQLQRQRVQAKQAQKARSPQTSSSIAEQNVQNILSSMRSEPVQYTPIKSVPTANFPKKQKSEAEMDEDEKFLASEEGKKLSSQERRQLRNKVSARAFRGRRKEYIGWLEGELTDRHNDSGLLRAQNKALIEENARLTSLTKMLLSSDHFRDLLSDLSSNPEKLDDLHSAGEPHVQAHARQQAQQEAEMQARLQAEKDANPHLAEQQHLRYQEHFRLHMMSGHA